MSVAFGVPLEAAAGRALDRLALADACHLYAAAVDLLGNRPASADGSDIALTEAVATLAECLAPDARVHLFMVGADGPSQPLGDGGPEATAAAIRAYFKAYWYVGTQHCVANIRVAFTAADLAIATSEIACQHWLADGRLLLTPVRYRDAFVRRSGQWLIARRDIVASRFWIAQGYGPDPLDGRLTDPAHGTDNI